MLFYSAWQGLILNCFRQGPGRGLGDLVISALDLQTGYRGFESCSGLDNFQIISTPIAHTPNALG